MDFNPLALVSFNDFPFVCLALEPIGIAYLFLDYILYVYKEIENNKEVYVTYSLEAQKNEAQGIHYNSDNLPTLPNPPTLS